MPLTPTQKFLQKRKELGWKQVSFWLTPEQVDALTRQDPLAPLARITKKVLLRNLSGPDRKPVMEAKPPGGLTIRRKPGGQALPRQQRSSRTPRSGS